MPRSGLVFWIGALVIMALVEVNALKGTPGQGRGEAARHRVGHPLGGFHPRGGLLRLVRDHGHEAAVAERTSRIARHAGRGRMPRPAFASLEVGGEVRNARRQVGPGRHHLRRALRRVARRVLPAHHPRLEQLARGSLHRRPQRAVLGRDRDCGRRCTGPARPACPSARVASRGRRRRRRGRRPRRSRRPTAPGRGAGAALFSPRAGRRLVAAAAASSGRGQPRGAASAPPHAVRSGSSAARVSSERRVRARSAG